jgi:hypothetical protein
VSAIKQLLGAFGGGSYTTAGDTSSIFEAGLANAGHLAGGGPAGTDTIPAWLSPGEFVMSKEAVDHIGLTNLALMNARGYDSGGIVGATSIPSGPHERATAPIAITTNRTVNLSKTAGSASDHEDAKT